MYKPNYLMMSPGPTMVRSNVLNARSDFFGNPDLDYDFFDFYKKLSEKIGIIFGVKNETVITMSGEGMLGLDATCASLTENGDEVLVISNGIFGRGFKDLVELYGGIVTLYEEPFNKEINIDNLTKFLENNSNFKYATIVHCDTPTGILNNIKDICKILKKYNILTVVDTVAAVGGTEFLAHDWGVDIAIGASQKVFSAPPGLTILTISPFAWKLMENRKTPIKSFYCNLLLWKNCLETHYFPYTLPASDLIALDIAINNILEEGLNNIYKRHQNVSLYTRSAIKNLGLKLYLEDSFSPTVTSFYVPSGFTDKEILLKLKNEFNILIAGSYCEFSGKLLRIGHMGENCKVEYVDLIINSLKRVLDI